VVVEVVSRVAASAAGRSPPSARRRLLRPFLRSAFARDSWPPTQSGRWRAALDLEAVAWRGASGGVASAHGRELLVPADLPRTIERVAASSGVISRGAAQVGRDGERR
jgi:hypothetical protein